MSEEVRRRWCAALAKLVQPDHPEEAVTALTAMLPMLSDMSDQCFSSRSALDAVATCRRRTIVPTYGDIRASLAAWLHEQPNTGRISGPADGLEPMDKAWVAFYDKRLAEYFAATESYPSGSRANLLSLIKTQSPKAYAKITGSLGEPERQAPTEDDRALVSEAVRKLRADLLGPREPKAGAGQGAFSSLSPEQLEAARRGMGIRVMEPA